MNRSTRIAAALGLLLGLPFSLSHLAHAQAAASARQAETQLRSKIYIYNVADGQSRLAFTDDSIWEAPNWSPDGKYLISNHNGAIYKLVFQPDGTLKPEELEVSAYLNCNNDKSLSPDGKQLAFSASTSSSHGSEVFIAKADGTGAKQMTTVAPSYFHGWSPDGKTIAFVAYRNGSQHFNIYTMPTAGGSETTRTDVPFHNDGPDYSPDGKWIYINSDRSGKEAIWRFPAKAQGAPNQGAEMVLSDGLEDWFPHISPNGKRMVYIGYPAGTPTHNSRELQVELKLTSVNGGQVDKNAHTIVTTMGGQGSLNVNSWAPDSEHFAYVNYVAMH